MGHGLVRLAGVAAMKLAESGAYFVRYEDRPYTGDFVSDQFDTCTDAGYEAWRAAGMPTVRRTEMREWSVKVDTLAEAQGVVLRCPTCASTHHVGVSFAGRGVLDHHGSHDASGRPTRWQVTGTGLADLTLRPSVDCTGGGHCTWHGFITNGEAT